jgi:hypothetical protein
MSLSIQVSHRQSQIWHSSSKAMFWLEVSSIVPRVLSRCSRRTGTKIWDTVLKPRFLQRFRLLPAALTF